MYEYATKADFRRFAKSLNLQEQSTLRKSAEDRTSTGATFLSHSSKDEEFVIGAIKLLEGHGATVYIDKKDPELPPYTNKNTASGLKNRISQSSKFVILASKNSKESRWVPWELGLADGYKGLDRIAILPAVEDQSDTSWANWEYLGLYDRIVWGDLQGHDKKVWMVIDEAKNTASKLDYWLKQS
tara:strand:+ start:6180 stop:6734 length:555 start_codon:yes stop_codon:yes gene_type:complete